MPKHREYQHTELQLDLRKACCSADRPAVSLRIGNIKQWRDRIVDLQATKLKKTFINGDWQHSYLLCLGILGEVLPNAVPATLSCSAGSAPEVATSAGCKMASKSQAGQDRTVYVCVWAQSFTFQHCSSSERCVHNAIPDRPGDHVHWGCSIVVVLWWMFMFASVPTFASALRVRMHVCVQVTLKLPDQMCRSLDCAEWWVAPSLTLQTCNKAHRSLQLMSSLYREHAASASSLPTVSIKASISGEQSFLCLRWHQTKELDTKCKSALSTWGGSSLFVSHGGVTGPFGSGSILGMQRKQSYFGLWLSKRIKFKRFSQILLWSTFH